MKFDKLDVLVESVARGVFDRSDVDEELHCFMLLEFGFGPVVRRHVGERAIWHCLGFPHILESVNAESRVHLAEVDAETWAELMVWAQAMGIGIVKQESILFRWELILVQYLVVLVRRYRFSHDVHSCRGLTFSLVHLDAYAVSLVVDLLQLRTYHIVVGAIVGA